MFYDYSEFILTPSNCFVNISNSSQSEPRGEKKSLHNQMGCTLKWTVLGISGMGAYLTLFAAAQRRHDNVLGEAFFLQQYEISPLTYCYVFVSGLCAAALCTCQR